MPETTKADLFVRSLPAIYQEQDLLALFLGPFESILLGGEARLRNEPPGLRETIHSLSDTLDPLKTREEFLPWLASWVALAFRADLPAARMRLLISSASSLYCWRGTRKGLEDLLTIVTGGGQPTIVEPEILTLTVGIQAVVGSTTRLGRDLPYYFEVFLKLPMPAPAANALSSVEALVRDTIELGKPAHTYYNLELSFAESAPPPSTSGQGPSRGIRRAASDVRSSS